MENYPSKDEKRFYNENEWNEKLRNVGLENIELRYPKPRFSTIPCLDSTIIRIIHDRIFPSIAFAMIDHNEKPRHMGKKWTSQKNDALSIYTFATWSEADDVFVSADYDDVIERREALYKPYKIRVARPVELSENHEVRSLREKNEKIPGNIVIQGHIFTPQETIEYLRKQLKE